MSIADEIKLHCATGVLTELNFDAPGENEKRSIYVAEPVGEILCGTQNTEEWENEREEEQAGYLAADLGRFIRGSVMTVSEAPKEQVCLIKRLEPSADEVWEIRSREPEPGIRVFGRFAAKDVFVAFVWEDRLRLGARGSREWRYYVGRCIEDWLKYFPDYPPHTGGSLHDYISNAVIL